MPILNGKKVTPFPGIKLKSTDALRDSVIQFDNVNTAPTTSTGYYYLYVTGGVLTFDNGSTTYNLLTGAGGGISSWDGLYDSDTSLTVDGASLTFAGTHATNDVITITATGSGDCLQITNSGSGSDIKGTSGTWSVSAAGAAVFTAITGCDTLTAAGNLAIDATGTGTITLGATSTGAITLTRAVTATASITITGTADSTVFTITNGDATLSNGLLSLDSDDTTTGNLVIPSSTATSGHPVSITADDITSGSCIYVDSDNEANFTGDGGYLNLTNNGTSVFKVQRYGALTIAGNAEGTASITCTAGDIVLTDGALVVTAGAITHTAGNLTMSDGRFSITESANAATFTINANGTSSASGIVLVGTGTHTGTTTTSWMTITPSGLTTGTGLYMIGAALTQGKLVDLATDASMTTGTILNVQCTGADDAVTSGMAASFDITATGIASSVNKTGSVVSITSNRTVTTGGTTSDDFDCLSVIKATTRSAGTAATAGSVIYAELQTTGTVTETSNGVEIVMDSGGTGNALKATHSATGAVAVNVISASTTVSDVLITGSGAKADNKACLEVTSTGATAAGGSLFRVATTSGTPAAATSYLVDFDYSGATAMTNNPITVSINSGSSTGAAIYTTGSGAGYSLQTINTNTGATGVQWYTGHQAGSSEADNDVIFTLHMAGADDAHAAKTFGKILCTAMDVSADTEDGKIDLQVMVKGTVTSAFYVSSSATNAGSIADSALLNVAAATITGSAAGTAALTLTNGDVSLSAGKFIATTTGDIYGLDITVNKATATQGVAVITNASTTSGKAVLELEQADLDKPYIKVSGATAITSATAGANGDVPAQVVGYLNVDVDGTERRIPYYAA